MTFQLDADALAAALFPIVLDSAEINELLAALQRPPRGAIRLRPGFDPARLPFATEVVPWHSRGRFLVEIARPGATLPFAAGEFYIQDASSLLPLALLHARPGELVCDLCAAPGGKSTGLLEDLGDSGWLLANEAVKSRCGALQFNLARHGSPRFLVTSSDPDPLAARLAETFHAVLVDAPCSGQSLVGRGKQTGSSFAPQTIEHCAARQTRILDAAARLVLPGGRLVYSTCTFAYAENERQVEQFLQRHPGWRAEPVPAGLAAHCSVTLDGAGARLWPHRHGSAGGFAALLVRGEDRELVTEDVPRAREPVLHIANVPACFREWGELTSSSVFQAGLQCFACPEDVPAELLAAAFAGPEIAFRKGATWFPSYSLAMRRDEHWTPRECVVLDDASARTYMQGHPLPGSLHGWGIAMWHASPLGWLKGDGRRMKNHLPKPARLLAAQR